jgi:protein TonB
VNIPPPSVNNNVDIGGPGGMNVAEGDYLPIVRVAPIYPARALSRGIEGYVDMSFTVTTAGTVKDPVVDYSTSSLFERAASQAVLKFKYKPRVVDGVPVEVPGVKTRISFQLEE